MGWLALDIGGAHLKVADGHGYAESYGFPLWKDSARLSMQLRSIVAEAPRHTHLAVTMTGELADCFPSKIAGVEFIVQAVSEIADGRHTRFYLSDGGLVAPRVARSRPLEAASSNWHALARFAGRYARSGHALLLDIGSTTSDIIPLHDGIPVPLGSNDTDRLLSGELVFSGVQRSPICALIHSAPYRGQDILLAQEVFATAHDAYLLQGKFAEEPNNNETADGRPATKADARRRLGRMICAGPEQFNHRDAAAIAQAFARAQLQLVAAAARRVIDRMPGPPATVVVCGQGEFLARRVLKYLGVSASRVSLAKELGTSASRCAPAHALAVLARELTGS